MLKLILLTGLSALLAATGATSLALMTIKPETVDRTIVTTHLQQL
jgi:hypothetical protein